MRKLLFLLLFLFLLGYSFELISRSAGAPEGASGAYADKGTNCTSCHGGEAFLNNTIISHNIPDSGYTPNTIYQFTIQLNGEGNKGFQLSVQDAFGNKQGNLIPNNETAIAGTKYLTHQFPKAETQVSWVVDWQAPDSGTGTVTLYGAYAITRLSTFKTVHTFPEAKKANSVQLLNFHPLKAGRNIPVKIYGKNLLNVDSVFFGNIKANSFSLNTDSVLEALPGNGSTGKITLYAGSFVSTMNGFEYVLKPRIVDIFPDTLYPNQALSIQGKNLLKVDSVIIGSKKIRNFVVIDDDHILIPAQNLNSGSIIIHSPGGIDSVQGFVFIIPSTGINSTSQKEIFYDQNERKLINKEEIDRVFYVYNIQGQKILTINLTREYNLPEDLPAGMYFLYDEKERLSPIKICLY